ncbi:venom allergen 5-like [Acanthaster planci]|uniref:Venom allergen 5-like n=1 Tax=Acanthaster planci TaxID=133434 RepID=A0A8B7XS62_ACAPL|nr:venom allergen 5-like [Acanthaster planci]
MKKRYAGHLLLLRSKHQWLQTPEASPHRRCILLVENKLENQRLLPYCASTAKQKQDILRWHNDFRNNVTPKAANMVKLAWGDDLARKAQDWADTCIDGHNSVKSNRRWQWIGENMAFSSDTDLREMVKGWEGERKVYDYWSNTCRPAPGDPMLSSCGHYTQMVWANTKFIGCGFKKGCPGRFPNRLVCNYGEGGNWIGEKPYESGGKCSQCPPGYGRCNRKLCLRG